MIHRANSSTADFRNSSSHDTSGSAEPGPQLQAVARPGPDDATVDLEQCLLGQLHDPRIMYVLITQQQALDLIEFISVLSRQPARFASSQGSDRRCKSVFARSSCPPQARRWISDGRRLP
jgi:hypothetical protein